jgi:hypothetical protein
MIVSYEVGNMWKEAYVPGFEATKTLNKNNQPRGPESKVEYHTYETTVLTPESCCSNSS